ncbi:MAG: dephospho-CoA kinase [Thermogutta sp.]
MWILGLLGGICSGKTFVAKAFGQFGAEVFDADRTVHQLLDSPNIRDQVVDHFGPTVLTSAGRIDRQRVAGLVFGDGPEASQQRKWLENLLHPAVRRELENAIETAEAAGRWLFVIDAPLLLEAKWSTLCHRLVYIDSPEDLRYARGRERGLESGQIVSREGTQIALNLKKMRADFVILNASDWQQVSAQISRIVDQLKQPPCPQTS